MQLRPPFRMTSIASWNSTLAFCRPMGCTANGRAHDCTKLLNQLHLCKAWCRYKLGPLGWPLLPLKQHADLCQVVKPMAHKYCLLNQHQQCKAWQPPWPCGIRSWHLIGPWVSPEVVEPTIAHDWHEHCLFNQQWKAWWWCQWGLLGRPPWPCATAKLAFDRPMGIY